MASSTDRKVLQRNRRHVRIRKKVSGTDQKPRLCITKSLKHIYAQLINDSGQKSLAFVTSNSKDNKGKIKNGSNMEAAKVLGKEMGELIKSLNITNIVFDRGGYQYHGVVKVFADSVRETGIQF